MRTLLMVFFSFYTFLHASSPMTFQAELDNAHSKRAAIYASGEIVQGSALEFLNFIKEKNIGVATVYFNSEGGNLMEGIYLGMAIRKMGYDTSIGSSTNKREGVCASACAYAYAGGVGRYVTSDTQRIGLHQFFDAQSTVGDVSTTQKIASDIAKHLHMMGIDERAFILASATKSDEMKWLSKEEALALNFANNGKEITTAEIKLLKNSRRGQKPYLTVTQNSVDGQGKLILYCKENAMHLIAGISTTKRLAKEKREGLTRNYLELSDGEFLSEEGKVGTYVNGSTLWLKRRIVGEDVARLLHSKHVNIWTEDATAFRWGIDIDLEPVKEKVATFIEGCDYSRTPEESMEETLSIF